MSAAFDNSEHQNENYCVVLASRPGVNNPPEDENFSCVICPMPAVENLGEEQVVVKTLYLSIDPALRCRMNEETGVEYITAWEVNKCISGLGGVGVVIHSRSQGLTTGDVVIKSDMFWPWQRFSTMDASALSKVEQKIAHTRPSLVLSLLGVSGITSFIGIRNRGHISPGKNQTVVITSAAGACGHLAGQFENSDGPTNVVGNLRPHKEKCCKFDPR
ncbi:PREDICTED: prostaglandin reductase 2-like [Priapulus caudatus]|uniref:15-oxoprostaglandin 13-reductase n=1 Tax=Priapulus caudatus TaxID=37621 RepID=A0ABM1EB06_PRICU|nr:PREDICTED: prostaglandin reductase 2-like [Priapulus caudatus]